jgi:putative resolvase
LEYYSIGKFAKKIGKSVNTLRVWDQKGLLKPHYVTEGGHRMYSEDQVYEVLGRPNMTKERITIGYCRVSTKKQQDDLQRQIELMQLYLSAKGTPFEIITDIGSGINYEKKGLKQLLDKVICGEVNKIVVLYRDRLVRFGWELMEQICKRYGTVIEVIDSTEKTDEQELVEDLIQIVTVFSCRLQGKRAHKGKKLIQEVKLLEKEDG